MGQNPKDQTTAASAAYIEAMAIELAEIARKQDLPLLAYLFDMAVIEASENKHSLGASDKPTFRPQAESRHGR